MWEKAVPLMSTLGLISLAGDAESRIGSHVAGGNPVNEYVERQQALLSLIQEELSKRS
jgi:hypothetical protein